ncbi:MULTISPECIES: universal stress protein [Streptomycetaceae]|uniref:UspA domain-containing protein n=1 Tax=Streptantibioticus cattleyicolor (strain ATCC 35852 / DSM 46488 / JCM 4925 / NBRC 14057 / NRRL 8057) TaxID=1003195 RepID=F8JYR2_STREN|nr:MULTISPECIES: universal stress protein [Streptomycetaceae]AEW93873.1 hypothetical protein SCATT_15020 [Streptantibioticus cattleyicolor NRRL 8057 = DSM 46488]MYS58556.1 universal stress protein [Streptomyces sp. SID5468]CCB74222.1 conserved protein of unknown function [Streptantibioticus cattleyicolor NRRL 8057 = DSM 46488]
MGVLVWVTEGTWPACVDAARARTRDDEELTLLYVADDEVTGAAGGAVAGLLGRGRPDPAARLAALEAGAAGELLDAAAARLGRPAARRIGHGRVEREVVRAAEGAALLVCARDGDRSRPGPHSLGPATRFVVDHAPCPVLLVWPPGPPPSAQGR